MVKGARESAARETVSARIYRGVGFSVPEEAGCTIALVREGAGRVNFRGKSHGIGAGDIIILIDRSAEIEADEAIELTAVDFMAHAIGEELAEALAKKSPVFVAEEDGALGDIPAKRANLFIPGADGAPTEALSEGAAVGASTGSRTAEKAGAMAKSREAEMILAIHAELRSRTEYSRQAALAILIMLATGIARSKNEYDHEGEVSSQVAAAIAYIKLHYQEKISLGELATICGVSPAYLSKRFTLEMGMGYADYVSLYRLTKAEKMLREEPDRTVTEVAFFCGFNDSNYFSDKFKKHFGIAPLKYRKNS